MNIERRKIEFAAKAVSGLRGIPLMLFGAAFVILTTLNHLSELGAQSRGNYGRDLTFTLTFFLLCIAFGFFVYPRIKVLYLNKYGQTKIKSQNFAEELLLVAPFLLGFFAGGAIDERYVLPFYTTTLFIAVFVFGLWWINYRGVSNVVLYLSLTFLAMSFLPWERIFLGLTVLEDASARASFYRAVCSVFCGITYIVMGATDYWFITKTLKPVATRKEEFYESV